MDARTGLVLRPLFLVDWPTHDKVLVGVGAFLPFALMWWLTLGIFVPGPEVVDYFSVSTNRWLVVYLYVQVAAVVGLLLLALGCRLRRVQRAEWLAYVTIQWFAVSTATVLLLTGPYTTPFIVYAVGLPVIGTLLFGVRPMYAGLATLVVLLVPALGLQLLGVLPYAPLFVGPPLVEGRLEGWWILGSAIPSTALAAITITAFLKLYSQLQVREAELALLAQTDPLTGLANRRRIEVSLAQQIARAGGQPGAVAILDADHFKRVNDVYGHAVGDRVLQIAAEELQSTMLGYGMVGRLGGEEFVVVFHRMGEGPPERWMELFRIRSQQAVGGRLDAEGLDEIRFSWSVGLTLLRSDDTNPVALQRADMALLDAKTMRNSLVVRA